MAIAYIEYFDFIQKNHLKIRINEYNNIIFKFNLLHLIFLYLSIFILIYFYTYLFLYLSIFILIIVIFFENYQILK